MNLALTLYAPRDIEKAHQLFGATCGPCSLAAAVRRDVCEIREAFPTFPEKQFTNLPMLGSVVPSSPCCTVLSAISWNTPAIA